VRLVVGVAVLLLIAARIDLRAASARPGAPLLAAVVGATALLLMSQAVAAFRWKIVLSDEALPWSYLFRLFVIAAFFGLFLPTSVGGDAVRAVAAARAAGRPGQAIGSVAIDRGFGVVAAIAYAALGFALAPEAFAILGGEAVGWRPPGWVGAGLIAGAIGVSALIFTRSHRIRALCHEAVRGLGKLARSPSRLGQAAALALLSQGLIVLLWYTLALGMHIVLPASTFLWAVPLVSVGTLLPVTLSGLGLREGIWLLLLAGSSIPPADIVVFSLLYFACTLLVGMIGGMLFISRGMTPRPREVSPA